MAVILSPSVVNPGVVSGPSVKLKEKSISLEDAHVRTRKNSHEIDSKIKKNSYKNKDKTPLAVKVAAGLLVIGAFIAFIKLKIKK